FDRVNVAEGDRAPCVVLCHGFGGTQDTPAIRAAARAFANAGFAALTFDYRNFGESGGMPRQCAMTWDLIRGWLGLSPYYIPAVGGPDELAVMASPQAQQAVDALDSAHWRNEIAPRVLFEMLRYRPGDAAHRLAMPVLVCIAEHDRETPPELARVIAERAPRGELKTYPITH